MIESLLLTTARVSTFFGTQGLTGASGFFFLRDERLYLVTNRHVLIDRPSGHLPDRIEIELHTDVDNLTRAAVLSVPLYRHAQALWHQGCDGDDARRCQWWGIALDAAGCALCAHGDGWAQLAS